MAPPRLRARLPDELWLVLVGLVVRVAYAVEHARSVYFDHPVLDSQWIHQWALALSKGEGSGPEAYFRAPLYPHVLGFLYRIFGVSQWPVVVFQHLLGLVCIVLIYRLGRRHFGRAVGVVAGLLFGLYWIEIFFEGEILLVTLETTLGLAFLERLSHATERTGRARLLDTAAAGLCLGLAAITRPNFLALVPLGLAWPWIRAQRPELRQAGVFLLAVALPIAPVTARNLLVARDFVPIAAQGGLNFYVGNGAGADGKTAAAPGQAEPMRREERTTRFRDNVATVGARIASENLGHPAKASEISSYWTRRTLKELARDPGGAARLALHKAYYLFNAFEISDNRDLAEVQRESRIEYVALVRLSWVLPLAFVGLLRARRFDRNIFLFVCFTFLYISTVWLFFVNARMRLPVSPAIMVLAAVGVVDLVGFMRRTTGKTAAGFALPMLALVGGAWLVNTRAFGVSEERGRPAFRFNRGVLLGELGHCAESVEAFDQALALDPGMLEAAFTKARTLERCGDRASARSAFDEVCRKWPDFPHGWLARARLQGSGGDLEGAARDYRMVMHIDPDLSDAYVGYGTLLGGKGRPDSALVYLERAVALDPRRLSGWLALGYTLAALDRREEAERAWRQALALDPGNRIAQQAIQDLQKGGGVDP